MYARKTQSLLAAAALFTLMAGAASAATPKTAAPGQPAQPKMTLAQPVVVLIGTASLEEYRRSDPDGRTETARTALAQRPHDTKAAPSGAHL